MSGKNSVIHNRQTELTCLSIVWLFLIPVTHGETTVILYSFFVPFMQQLFLTLCKCFSSFYLQGWRLVQISISLLCLTNLITLLALDGLISNQFNSIHGREVRLSLLKHSKWLLLMELWIKYEFFPFATRHCMTCLLLISFT